MRYLASEKLEIIRIVEQSHLPAKRTLDQLGIARRAFYRWYDRYLGGGPEALEDRPVRVHARSDRDQRHASQAVSASRLPRRRLSAGPGRDSALQRGMVAAQR
jgi:hypothetical protein